MQTSIFWTGGWDSTFRLLQLAERQINIKPIYIKDPARKSAEIEIARMTEILDHIKKRKASRGGVKAEIRPLEIIDRDNILKQYVNREISEAWHRLHNEFQLGEQYEWFALYCNATGLRVECGLERSERSKAMQVISAQCRLAPFDGDDIGGRLHVLPKEEQSSSDGYVVFRNLLLGITDTTKEDARSYAEAHGWLDIMKRTWFCFNPIGGKPCGLCNPCRDAMNGGMGWRMPAASKARYYLLGPIHSFAKQTKRMLRG